MGLYVAKIMKIKPLQWVLKINNRVLNKKCTLKDMYLEKDWEKNKKKFNSHDGKRDYHKRKQIHCNGVSASKLIV